MILAGFVVAVAVVTLQAQSAPAEVQLIPAAGDAAKYWPRWRGPSGQGHVSGTNYTDTWSNTDHVKWRVPVPGLGHSSPIVWGDRICF